MKQTVLFLICSIFISLTGLAQTNVADFELLPLNPDTFWNGSDNINSGFSDGDFYFPTEWNSEWNFWSGGFAYSNMRDTVTQGFTNMFSARPGIGAEATSNYIVTYGDGYYLINGDKILDRFFISNNTFAYFSMLNGDDFAKKFGGNDGNDPDYFRVSFTYYRQGIVTAEQTIYLADFRFEDNSQDYILNDWLEVQTNLSDPADSVTYFFESSDVGNFGINTPTYFCMDQLYFNLPVATSKVDENNEVRIYPNPTSGTIFIHQHESKEASNGFVMDLTGKCVKQLKLNETYQAVAVGDLKPGIYFVVLNNNPTKWHKVVIQ